MRSANEEIPKPEAAMNQKRLTPMSLSFWIDGSILSAQSAVLLYTENDDFCRSVDSVFLV